MQGLLQAKTRRIKRETDKFSNVMKFAATPDKLSVPLGTFSNAAQIELNFCGELSSRVATSAWTAPSEAGTRPDTLALNDDLDLLLESIILSSVKRLTILLQGNGLTPSVKSSLTRLVKRLPALQDLTLTCTGLLDVGTTSFAIALNEDCLHRGLDFGVNLILDSDADAFDAPNLYSDTSQTLPVMLNVSRSLLNAGTPVRWLVPMVRSLVYRLEPLFSLARDEGVDPVLAPHWITRPTQGRVNASLDNDERLFVHDFIAYRLLDEEAHLVSQARSDWYQMLNDALMNHGNFEATRLQRVAVLSAAESEQGCGWTLDFEDRPSFDAALIRHQGSNLGQRTITRAATLLKQAMDVSAVLTAGTSAATQWVRAWFGNLTRLKLNVVQPTRFNKVLLIGAYGGDHIGDTAILGGVLLRLNHRYGTKKAILMSQRPAHTGHLVPMLDTPVHIEVAAYEHASIRECMSKVDAVVFAGGPLIDQPKQLVRHLYTVSLAHRHGKPFLMEGIGPGPFPRWPSEWTARRIVHMAERIVVRTSADSETRIMRNVKHDVGRDPAFDYLETRGELTRLRDQERQWIEQLLKHAEGRLLVGINLRPIRHHFTVGVPAAQRAVYTRAVEARFEKNFAEGIRRFHRESSQPPCFVFFPMNAIQFGSSDLRSAYRVHRHLRGDVDCRVWQADVSLDGVVALLRRLDIAITMRFHATIFTLAQQRNVIGIDYRIGQRDKVGALLDDFGQSENCSRIDELTASWLVERLDVFAEARHAIHT